MGWTYLVNDENISSIGRYIRGPLSIAACELGLQSPFGWEGFHRSDKRRVQRKISQLFVDELCFVAPGLVGVVAYLSLVTDPPWAMQVVAAAEVVLLAGLGTEIAIYADLARSPAVRQPE